MSLIDQAAKNVSPYKLMMQEKASQNENKQYIVQPTVLLNILNDEMEKRVIDKKEKKQFAGYRTRLKTTEWRLAGILNHVDEEIYREQIDKTIEGMLKHIKLVQPNGEWVLKEYETDIRANKSGHQCIILAANFVDSKNEDDMRYQNGVPLVDVKVDVSNSNKELIEAIQAQGLSGQNSGDPEVKALLLKLTELMIAEKEKTQSDNKQSDQDVAFEDPPADLQE